MEYLCHRVLLSAVSTESLNDIKFENAVRRKGVVITRFHRGKCILNSYLYTINRRRDGLCSMCKVPETIEHYLWERSIRPIPNAIISVYRELSIQPTSETVLNNSTIPDIIDANNYYWEI